MATAEVRLPLYFWRKQRYGSEEAYARLSEARANYRSTKQELVFMVRDQYLTAKASERLLKLFESGTLPQAHLALESTTSAYEVGKVDFLSLLNSLTSVLALEKQYYQELARHEQALARIEPLVGRELTQP
jgi:outer membrane protein TolC